MNTTVIALIEARAEDALGAIKIFGGWELFEDGRCEFWGYDYKNQAWIQHEWVIPHGTLGVRG